MPAFRQRKAKKNKTKIWLLGWVIYLAIELNLTDDLNFLPYLRSVNACQIRLLL